MKKIVFSLLLSLALSTSTIGSGADSSAATATSVPGGQARGEDGFRGRGNCGVQQDILLRD